MRNTVVYTLTDPVRGALHAAMFGQDQGAPTFSMSARLMGTTANVTTVGAQGDLPARMIESLERLSGLWSRFIDDSEISRLNNSPGVPLEVSVETVRLIEKMQAGYTRSKGAFDPTLLPALIAEGYGSSLVNPDARTRIPKGSRNRGSLLDIVIEGNRVTLPLGTTLDSGGVGKGLAADMVAEFALTEGALGAMVEVGGDLRTIGLSPRADRWRLAIEHPLEPGVRLAVVELSDQGLATSTVTKRRFSVDGRATHHIINPKTLASADSDTIQASVIADTAAEAEMWTKVAFVRGSKDLLTRARTHGFHAACFLRSGEWVTTPGWPVVDA